MNILFVAFEFPPLGGGGVQRSMKFVKYLPEFGIRPIVVTIKEDDYPKVLMSYNLDPQLMQELPADTVIERIHCQPTKRPAHPLIRWWQMFFSVSEVFKKTWKKELEISLPLLIEKYQPRAIYVTLPPFAMATLWRKLLEKYQIPLIIDFRDAWSQWCVSMNGSYFHYLKKKKEERKILEKAEAVICSTSQIKNDLLKVHPKIDASKITVITNGYDETLPSEIDQLNPQKEKIIFGYVGNFYYTPESRKEIFRKRWTKPPHRMLNYVPRKEDWLYRSPYFFLKTVQSFIEKNPSWSSKIEIHFAGKTPDWLSDQIRSFGLERLCRHLGYLSHQAVIDFQQSCDALLITSSKVIGGRDYSIAGKTFEYFAIGKPILSFVCEGAQKEILEESGMAVFFNPDETEAAVKTLEAFLSGKIKLTPNRELLRKYHRRNLTERLAEVFHNSIVEEID